MYIKSLIQFIYQNKNINLKKYTTPSFMLTQSSDVQQKFIKSLLYKKSKQHQESSVDYNRIHFGYFITGCPKILMVND